MLRLRKLYLYLFFVNIAAASAYTPITWIEGNPNNLFSPLCVVDVHGRFKKCSPWQGHVRANLFSTVKFKEYNYGYEGYGVALQGHLHLDRLLQGLYGQLYLPALLVHKKELLWYWENKSEEDHERDWLNGQEKSYNSSSAYMADIPILIGWEAIQRKSWHLSGYFVGIIPTKKYAFKHHLSCGPGLDSVVRLWGKPKHHIDWHLMADMTFWQGTNGTGVLTSETNNSWTNDSNDSKTLVPIRIHANRMDRIQSDISYKFKHFISDIGAQYIHIPEEKCSLIKQLPIPVNKDHISDQYWLGVFFDVGWEVQIAKLPSYATIGTQGEIGGPTPLECWNINVKIGTQF